MNGHLELVCAPDAAGRSVLARQSFCAPVHLSKAHREGETLRVNVVNPTAGLFAGDAIRWAIRVETGARLLLTSPSASRAHRMPEGNGREARFDQTLNVAAGARLEIWPELFIPQRGTCYRQTTRAAVEAGGELLLFEAVAPGRAASGERFEYRQILWETDLLLAGRLIARERYALIPGSPANPAIDALRARFPAAYYASALVVSPRLARESPCWETIDALHGDQVWIGSSALEENVPAGGGWAVKVLAADSVALRKTMTTVRAAIYESMGEAAPELRRV